MKKVPVFILIRTSARPEFFKVMMDSIKEQTYQNIVTIVHTDDENDTYVEGDEIIYTKRRPKISKGHYNLYCNKLLDAIPGNSGYYHFIDDDDKYAGPDVIEKFVENSLRTHMNIARVKRWGNTIFPKTWGDQMSYQTECFMLHVSHKDKARWYNKKGGDHYYSKQLTTGKIMSGSQFLKQIKPLPLNWIDNLIVCEAQKGKGRGERRDLCDPIPSKGSISRCGARLQGKMVDVKYVRNVNGPVEINGKKNTYGRMTFEQATRLQKLKRVIIIE